MKLRQLIVVAAGLAGWACDNECPEFGVVRAIMDSPVRQAPDDIPWFGGARGDLRFDQSEERPSDFDDISAAVLTNSSTFAVVRWTAFTRDERMFVLEHPTGLDIGDTITVSGVVEDIEFTGGYGTFGWWQPRWSLFTTGSTIARANLIRAFSQSMDMVSAEGTIDVVAIEPFEFELNVVFTDDDGRQIRAFSDVTFNRQVNVEICSP